MSNARVACNFPVVQSGIGMVCRRLGLGLLSEAVFVLLLIVLWNAWSTKSGSDDAAITLIHQTVWLGQAHSKLPKRLDIDQRIELSRPRRPVSGGGTQITLAISFAADPHQELNSVLRRYGGLLGFGDQEVAEYRFSPPAWKELLPREPVSISAEYYPIHIRNPDLGSFVAAVRSSIPAGGKGLHVYALFPLSFQEIVEQQIYSFAKAVCRDTPAVAGKVAFAKDVPSGVKVLKVDCAPMETTIEPRPD